MREAKFWQIKPEIRILGVDDGSFAPHIRTVPLVATVFRGGKWFDGVMKTDIAKDGEDVTEKLIAMVRKSRHLGQLRVIMTDGITFGGFNVLDARRVFRELGLPVIAVSRRRPNMVEIKRAIKHLPGWKKRWEILRKTGKIYSVKTMHRGGEIFIQPIGIKIGDARRIVEMSSIRSLIPEPIRAAHMIATAIAMGESHGRV
ncbi:MAG: DUF99 family protein [Candidatus Hadarchaeales archaeon]